MASLGETLETSCVGGSEGLIFNERMARSWAVTAHEPKDVRLAILARTIEGEIIPRLMLAHRGQGTVTIPARLQPSPSAEDVAEFASLILSHDCAVGLAFVETLRGEGLPLERIFLDLLAPAARHLGELWKQDLCDFTDVTVGLTRLQQVVRSLSPAFEREGEYADGESRALIAPMPNDQHGFGAVIVEEFLRRAGWDVWSFVQPRSDELVDCVSQADFGLIGLSLCCDSLLDECASLIRRLRRASRNPNVWVMVGGRAFLDHLERVALVGADATAADGRQVVRLTRHLLPLRAVRA